LSFELKEREREREREREEREERGERGEKKRKRERPSVFLIVSLYQARLFFNFAILFGHT